MSIKELVQRYEHNRDYYLTDKYNETLLRSDFLDPLFELLGWDIKNQAGKATNEREVILEESLRANASENSKKPDYTFRLFSERKFFLEAKKPSVAIESNNETAQQARRYGFTAKLKISLLSNFEYLVIYDTSVIVDNTDTFQKALVKKYHYTEYEGKFEEIKRLLSKESVYSGQFDIEWQDIENRINQYSIDNLFLQQINEWRTLLGGEIYKHDPRISEQQLNDIVQSYLNRLLFLRVCEDRNLEVYQTLLKFADGNDFAALIKKFEEADAVYNSGLFDQLLANEIIENVSSVFWTIIKQLYYPESAYSFAVFSSDILGNIYEIFLSEKLVIRENSIVLEKKPEHIDRDIITTPTFIISDILRQTVISKIEGKTDVEIINLKFADIACGSGAFLLELFQLLNDLLIDYYLRTDKAKLIQTNINTFKLPLQSKRELILSCIYGIDKDYNAVEAAKFGLLLKLLEGEDINSTNKSKPILPDLANNIFFGNSLISSENVNSNEDNLVINSFDFGELRFDVIVGNPPYMKSEDMKNITPLELPIYKQLFASAYKQFDKYFLFIEQGLNLLTEDGILGFIVPSKFMKVGAAKKLREKLSVENHLHSIISFGANQIFTDKTTYTCLLILNKRPQDTFQYAEVRNLAKWKVRKPEEVKFATETTAHLDNEVWALVPPELITIYAKTLEQSIKLVDLVGEDNIFNGIQTSANEIYIFTPTDEDQNYYYFTKRDIPYRIEKDFTKPYFKTSGDSSNLNTYRSFKPNAQVIYPYIKTDDGVALIPLSTVQKDFPEAYNYLQAHKDILNNPRRDIKPEPATADEWHRYGRHQSLDSCGLAEKIIVGVLSVGDKYAIDTYGTLISSGGTAGYCVVALPDESDYSIYYIQAVLNSKYLEWFSTLYGEVFRGGYIARGTKVLKNLPIRRIDFENAEEKEMHDRIARKQQELIALFDRMDASAGDRRLLTPLERQFKNEKRALENYLTELYDLGKDDGLIPLIKNLYETN
jgi:type I restriction-modification system DNA methylase subunit